MSLVALGLVAACSGAPDTSRSSGLPATETTSVPPIDVARAFLAAWAVGDAVTASEVTSDPHAAAMQLTAFRTQLNFASLELSPADSLDGDALSFTVNVSFGETGSWRYSSKLELRPQGREHKVNWSPSIIHPQLTAKGRLRLASLGGGAPPVLGKGGEVLSADELPSLGPLLPKIAAAVPAPPAKPSTVVQLQEPERVPVTLATLQPSGGSTASDPPGGITTTIDPGVQRAAEDAVARSPAPTGLVVLRASTGEILAMANNPPGGQNQTVVMQPPGSTMKVVLASALLRAGDTPNTVVPCPEQTVVDGKPFHNGSAEASASNTLQRDLAVSCNTAFIDEGRSKLPRGALGSEASAAFGLTVPWDIGLKQPRTYGSVPDPGASQTQWAENLIGQGTVEMTPLAMASVAATVATGSFHQPVLLPEAPRVSAAGLFPALAGQLQQMMRAVVNDGTATSLRGMPGSIGAKTGTAETGSGSTNGWVIAFRGDYAVACVVVGGGAGDASAGPVVRGLFTLLPS